MHASPPAINLLEDPIKRCLLHLALPVMVTSLLETAYLIIDGVFVGLIGTNAVAAVNSASFFIWLLYSLFYVISTGTSSLVAQCIGARRETDALLYAATGIVGNIAFSIVLAAIGIAVAPALLRSMGLEPAVVTLGWQFLSVILLGGPVYAADEVIGAVLRGYGDTRTPMLVYGSCTACNIVLAPLLILGPGPLPALGVAGVALSTVLSWCLAPLLYFYLLKSGRLLYRPNRATFRLDLRRLKEIVHIGGPSSIQATLFSLVYMGLVRILSDFGTAPVAAVGIGHRVEAVTWLVCVSFSTAAATMVGQNKGAGNLERAEKSAWTAAGLAAIGTAAVAGVILMGAWFLCRLFSDDPAVLAIAADYVRIQAVTHPLMAVAIVLDGAFSGAGNTVPSMAISVPLTLARLPLAWFFASYLGYGVVSVWVVITVTVAMRGLLTAYWFRRGEWKRHRALQLQEAPV